MSLVASLQAFDGTRVAPLERLSRQLPQTAASVTALLGCAHHADPRVGVGATWILKRWQDEGAPCVQAAVEHLMRSVPQASHRDVRLHLVQILAGLRLPSRGVHELTTVLREWAGTEPPLVRAWALSVLAQVADQHEALRRDIRLLLTSAESDGAASVRARVRRLRAHMPWIGETREAR